MEKHTRARLRLSGTARLSLLVQFTLLAVLLASLAGCSPSTTPAPTEVKSQEATATATQAPTDTPMPVPTATQAPTETPEPTATDKPTATAIPALGIVDGGFDTWCMPTSYAGTKVAGPEAPADARRLTITGSEMEVRIPAAYCVTSVTFNQAAPAGAMLYIYDSGSPFLKLPLKPSGAGSDVAWASFNHDYVVNPPYWQVTYRMAVVSADGKELWSNPVNFAKETPQECPYGGLPDPVTLWCAITDPWEIEPHPDATYPYDRSKLPTQAP